MPLRVMQLWMIRTSILPLQSFKRRINNTVRQFKGNKI
jgi:hypothetical protein